MKFRTAWLTSVVWLFVSPLTLWAETTPSADQAARLCANPPATRAEKTEKAAELRVTAERLEEILSSCAGDGASRRTSVDVERAVPVLEVVPKDVKGHEFDGALECKKNVGDPAASGFASARPLGFTFSPTPTKKPVIGSVPTPGGVPAAAVAPAAGEEPAVVAESLNAALARFPLTAPLAQAGGDKVLTLTEDPATGGVRGRFHNMSFTVAEGQSALFSTDGTKILFANGVDSEGRPRLTGWVGDGQRGRLLADGSGQIVEYRQGGRVHKDIVLDPVVFKRAASGGIDLSSIPDADLPAAKRVQYERLLNELPRLGGFFQKALDGRIQALIIRDGQLNVQFDEKTRLSAVIDGGAPKAFIFSGATVMMWAFNADVTSCDRSVMDPNLRAEEGRALFRFGSRHEKRGASWVRTKNEPAETKSWGRWDAYWDNMKGNAQAVGTVAGYVFSPFQSAVAGIEGSISMLIGAVGGDLFQKIHGHYTYRQAHFNEWVGNGLGGDKQIMDAYLEALSMAGDERRLLVDALDADIEKTRREQEGELALVQQGDREISDTERAHTAARIFGLGNLGGLYIRHGADNWETGHKWVGGLQIAGGYFVKGGQVYVEGFGFGAMAQSVKLVGAGKAFGVTTAEVAKAASLGKYAPAAAPATQAAKLARWAGHGEMAVMMGPAVVQATDNIFGMYAAGDDRISFWTNVDGLASNAAMFVFPMAVAKGRAFAEKAIMDRAAKRKVIDIKRPATPEPTINVAAEAPLAQPVLKANVDAAKPNLHRFVKDVPILGYRITSDRFADLPEIIQKHLGAVDRTKYTPEYLRQNIGSVIALQMNGAVPDFYVIGKETYTTKYKAVPPAEVGAKNAKLLKGLASVEGVSSLLNAGDPNVVGVLKTVPVEMVRMSEVNYPVEKSITIESPWGAQTKPAGQDGYLVFDGSKGQYYMVNVDAAGLPINYTATQSAPVGLAPRAAQPGTKPALWSKVVDGVHSVKRSLGLGAKPTVDYVELLSDPRAPPKIFSGYQETRAWLKSEPIGFMDRVFLLPATTNDAVTVLSKRELSSKLDRAVAKGASLPVMASKVPGTRRILGVEVPVNDYYVLISEHAPGQASAISPGAFGLHQTSLANALTVIRDGSFLAVPGRATFYESKGLAADAQRTGGGDVGLRMGIDPATFRRMPYFNENAFAPAFESVPGSASGRASAVTAQSASGSSNFGKFERAGFLRKVPFTAKDAMETLALVERQRADGRLADAAYGQLKTALQEAAARDAVPFLAGNREMLRLDAERLGRKPLDTPPAE